MAQDSFPNDSELEGLSKDDLLSLSQRLGIPDAQLLTRVELQDEIRRLRGDVERGFLGKARDLLRTLASSGLQQLLIRSHGEPATIAPPEIAHEKEVKETDNELSQASLLSVTLAEVYLAQGLTDQARDVVRIMLRTGDQDPALLSLAQELELPIESTASIESTQTDYPQDVHTDSNQTQPESAEASVQAISHSLQDVPPVIAERTSTIPSTLPEVVSSEPISEAETTLPSLQLEELLRHVRQESTHHESEEKFPQTDESVEEPSSQLNLFSRELLAEKRLSTVGDELERSPDETEISSTLASPPLPVPDGPSDGSSDGPLLPDVRQFHVGRWKAPLGVNECVLMAVEPRKAFVYWEVRSDLVARALAAMALEEGLSPCLRIHSLLWNESAYEPSEVDVFVAQVEHGELFLEDLNEGAVIRVAIGLKSQERFLPLVHSLEVTLANGRPSSDYAFVWQNFWKKPDGPEMTPRPSNHPMAQELLDVRAQSAKHTATGIDETEQPRETSRISSSFVRDKSSQPFLPISREQIAIVSAMEATLAMNVSSWEVVSSDRR